MRQLFIAALMAVVLVAGLISIGCGGDSDPFLTNVPPVTIPSPALQIVPSSPIVAPHGTVHFGAVGGSDTGYAYAITTNNSGGTIDAATGNYQAGATGGVSDTVQVTDSQAHTATATVTVQKALSVSPAAPAVTPLGSKTFTATGGSGSGYVFSITSNVSGGTINSSTGAYTAGTASGIDTVTVTDSQSNTANAFVTVGAVVTITPSVPTAFDGQSITFKGSGGSGTGYTFAFLTNGATSTLTGAGVYTAGGSGPATDIIKVTDSLGNIGITSIDVEAPLSIIPGGQNGTVIIPGVCQGPNPNLVILSASNGSGNYTWSITTNNSGGAFIVTGGNTSTSPQTGATVTYQAGGLGSDVITLTDNGASPATTTTVTIEESGGGC